MADSKSTIYRVVSDLVDFADGRVRAMGQTIELDAEALKDEFNKDVIAAGKLLKVEEAKVRKALTNADAVVEPVQSADEAPHQEVTSEMGPLGVSVQEPVDSEEAK